MANRMYRDAGVDVEAGYKAVELMQRHVARTLDGNVISSRAGFGGLYRQGDQILVAGTDGVGTKLKIAFEMDKHDTVGIDCVAMCVNDVVCHGARPLFFLDYIATGKVYPDVVAALVEGIAEGCVRAGCALIGGETAEMPGFYKTGEYDLAGFAVGSVAADKLIDAANVQAGDVLIGLASSGLHSNGFSLVRKTFNITEDALGEYVEVLGSTFGEALMEPTRIYAKNILELSSRFDLHGVANITGGGFYENIPRILPDGLRARVEMGSWTVLPIFDMMRNASGMDEMGMYGVFNMGLGMVLAASASQAMEVVAVANGLGEVATVIGSVVEGETGVDLCR